jgi:ParB family chromosome partitioning protein
MSSFKAKVAQAAKNKAKANNASTNTSASGNTTVPEEQVGNVVTDEAVVVEETTEKLYGEDSEDAQDKPKWERTIPLDRIRPNPFQPRKTFDAAKLDELAAGMREHGWIGGGLPVRAHPTEPNTYELVWGERRWRAARIAELKTIPCVVSTYTDNDMIEKGLLENIQREDLSNLEEGQAYVNLLALRNEEGKPRYSIRRLAQRIGKDKSYIEDRLLYARVPLDVQQLAADQPDISPRIIRELGELSKLLKEEERAPVVEGVREGKLRIEDVREIRKDVEQQRKNEATVSAAPIISAIPEQVSRATNTPHSSSPVTQEQQPEVNDPVSTDTALDTAVVQPQGPASPVSTPSSPLASAMVISVFEKTLKRDNEALERIFQRLLTSFDTYNEAEQQILMQYVMRWHTSLQNLMSRWEQHSIHQQEEE